MYEKNIIKESLQELQRKCLQFTLYSPDGIHELSSYNYQEWLDTQSIKQIENLLKCQNITNITSQDNLKTNSFILYTDTVNDSTIPNITITFPTFPLNILYDIKDIISNNIKPYISVNNIPELIDNDTIFVYNNNINPCTNINDSIYNMSLDMYRICINNKTTSSNNMPQIPLQIYPTQQQLYILYECMHQPLLTSYTLYQKQLLYTFRYNLLYNPYALTKFLRCIDWNNDEQILEATTILRIWEPIDPKESLQLLTKNYTNIHIRSYAIQQLYKIDDDNLRLYLLMLVQSLQYEISFKEKPCEIFLFNRSCNNFILCTYLYWYLYVEIMDTARSLYYEGVLQRFLFMLKKNNDIYYNLLLQQKKFVHNISSLCITLNTTSYKVEKKREKLRELLIDKQSNFHHLIDSKKKPTSIPLQPNIFVTYLNPINCNVFKSAMSPLLLSFCKVSYSLSKSFLSSSVLSSIENGNSNIDDFVSINDDNISLKNDIDIENTTTTTTTILNNNDDTIRDSNTITTDSNYRIIYKQGDDLRQDQLVVQLFAIMDKHLQEYNINLKLTIYDVLATDIKGGFVEFIENSRTLLEIQNDRSINGSICSYLEKYNPTESLLNEALRTYSLSCAGYCVQTYLLGVGDRHLENIMLQQDGHLFHIDFGWCFGYNPKPLSPPIRLTKEMVEAMGGIQSLNYHRFCNACCDAFLVLRKAATLILSQLYLMIDSSIPHIVKEKRNEEILQGIQDRFCLHLNDDEARAYFLRLLDDALSAVFPMFTDIIHSFASNFK